MYSEWSNRQMRAGPVDSAHWFTKHERRLRESVESTRKKEVSKQRRNLRGMLCQQRRIVKLTKLYFRAHPDEKEQIEEKLTDKLFL